MNATDAQTRLWSYDGPHAQQLTPTEAARLFADDYTEGPARVVVALDGNWLGQTWAGSFLFDGGQRIYRMTYAGGIWEVFGN